MPRPPRSVESGFSLPELMIAMAIMLVISGAAVGALLKMTTAQATIWNRTQMHSGIRGATEVLQQEVGQAGRVALPTSNVMLVDAVTTVGSASPQVSSTNGMFVGEKLTIDAGTTSPTSGQEVVTVTAISGSAITATFTKTHSANAPVRVFGSFSAGIVPPKASPSTYAGSASFTYTDGSDGNILKLFGDINADGKMVYIEYSCDIPAGGTGNLYRNVMAWNATGGSPSPTSSQILLSNLKENPGGTPCFKYQTEAISGTYFVTDVAITLTVQTQNIDPVTKDYQKETKALLNVSPRNVFNAWQLLSLGITDRIQPIPPSITALLP